MQSQPLLLQWNAGSRRPGRAPQGTVRVRRSTKQKEALDKALELDDLLDLGASRGATVKGNDIYLDPEKILPPPAIAGGSRPHK